MVFSTPIFFFYFLALTLLVYYLVPRKLRNLVILCASLLFYYWGERVYVLIMFLSTAIDFTHGLLVEHYKKRDNDRAARMAVVSSIVFNLALLFFFKYWDFLAGSLQAMGLTFMPVLNIHLPIGISFYTFQTMSYTIDVYRGDAKAQKSIIGFGTFVTLFPQLIAGPIIKYKDLDDQLGTRRHSLDQFASGVERFVAGLAKKLLIANNLGQLWDACKVMGVGELTVVTAWLGILAFAFQIYFDFSGYSDMAIGLGRMFGFEFMENFNYPYISKSITEFWRRWHISLSTWFREYLYIPLGGSRRGKARTVLNKYIVFFTTGLWHGASLNFIVWGLFHGTMQMAEEILRPTERRWLRPIWRMVTLGAICLSFVVFRADTMADAAGYLAVLFGAGGASASSALALLDPYTLTVLGFAAVFCFPIVPALRRRADGNAVLDTLGYAITLPLFALCVMALASSTYNPFIYFRF